MAAERVAMKRGRPLSPHLQIYRPSITMVMSIVHRLTGMALYLGTALLAWFLIAVGSGPQQYALVQAVMTSGPGRLVLIGYTWALLHHMLGGLRHFIWDTGRGFALPVVNRLSWLSIIGSLALTAAIWSYVLLHGRVVVGG